MQLCSSLNILWYCLSLGLAKKVSAVATAEFSKFAGILSIALSQHHLLGFEIAQLEFTGIHYLLQRYGQQLEITSTSFVHSDAS